MAEGHLALDNFAARKSATVGKSLIKRPHRHLPFAARHASWLEQAERFFAPITREAIA